MVYLWLIIYNFNITYTNRNDKLIRLIPFRRICINWNYVVDKEQNDEKVNYGSFFILKRFFFEFSSLNSSYRIDLRYLNIDILNKNWTKMTILILNDQSRSLKWLPKVIFRLKICWIFFSKNSNCCSHFRCRHALILMLLIWVIK